LVAELRGRGPGARGYSGSSRIPHRGHAVATPGTTAQQVGHVFATRVGSERSIRTRGVPMTSERERPFRISYTKITTRNTGHTQTNRTQMAGT